MVPHKISSDEFWGRSKLGAKDNIPESASDTKTILVIHEVMLEVVFLECFPVRRQILVVQEVVSQVIADITEDATTEHRCRNMPIPVEYCVCEFPEWQCKG